MVSKRLAGALVGCCVGVVACGTFRPPPRTPAQIQLGTLHEELLNRMQALHLRLQLARDMPASERAAAERELLELRAKRDLMVQSLLAAAEALGASQERGRLARQLQLYQVAATLAFDHPDLKRVTSDRLRSMEGRILEAEARLTKVARGGWELPCAPAKVRARLTELINLREDLAAMTPVTSLAVRAAERCEARKKLPQALELYALAQELARAWDPMPAPAVARHAFVMASVGTPAPSPAPVHPAAPQELAAEPVDEGARLAKALRALRDEKGIFAALVALEATSQQHPSRPELTQLAHEWAASRSEILASLVERANRALAEENPEAARALYEKVLQVDPQHALARERLERLDALRQLRQGAPLTRKGT